jgi:hypothetical protein
VLRGNAYKRLRIENSFSGAFQFVQHSIDADVKTGGTLARAWIETVGAAPKRSSGSYRRRGRRARNRIWRGTFQSYRVENCVPGTNCLIEFVVDTYIVTLAALAGNREDAVRWTNEGLVCLSCHGCWPRRCCCICSQGRCCGYYS